MGTSSSSSIKNIHLEQNNDPVQEFSKKKQKDTTKDRDKLHTEQLSKTDLVKKKQDEDQNINSQIETLTKQLCESESQCLDLEDHVETLMKELNYVNSESLAREGEGKPCEETVHAKDQYIFKLEKETKDLKTEVKKLKQRQRRRQKQFNTQMAEYKQEANFQMMELREDISNLKLKNRTLQEAKAESEGASTKLLKGEMTPKLAGGEKMTLILDLSQQVTEQQDKIAKLERRVEDKDQVVEELRTRMKNNAQYLSALNKTDALQSKGRVETYSIGNGDRNTKLIDACRYGSGTIANSKVGTENSSLRNEKIQFKTDHDIDGLFTVDEESSGNEEDDSLKKLSSLLKDVKVNNDKATTSVDSFNENNNSIPGNSGYMAGLFEEPENNNGRDSGLGSAGKREDEYSRKTGQNRSWKTGTDWKDVALSMESGSGLSDSDFEPYGPAQSKISSAPPKLQTDAGAKLKKKSNSLRKRTTNRKDDKPPRPGVAFLNSAESMHRADNLMSKLSPIISRVEVS